MKRMITVLGLLAGGIALMLAPTVQADPQSDFERGVAAHQAGDVISALVLLQRAADQGHVGAMVRAGYVLAKSGESRQAYDMYTQAAEAGNAEAILAVGVMLANGDGVERNAERALESMTRAAEMGHGPAMVTLAQVHLQGTLGVPADREAAVDWLQRAIAAGYEPARKELAMLQHSEDSEDGD